MEDNYGMSIQDIEQIEGYENFEILDDSENDESEEDEYGEEIVFETDEVDEEEEEAKVEVGDKQEHISADTDDEDEAYKLAKARSIEEMLPKGANNSIFKKNDLSIVTSGGVKRKNRVVPIQSLIELSDREVFEYEDETKDAFGADEKVDVVQKREEHKSYSNMGGFNHLFDDEALDEILRDGDRRKHEDQQQQRRSQ